MLIYFLVAIYGSWGPSYYDAGSSPYCEYFDPNRPVGEPLNTWSNFFYVSVGILVLIYYDLLYFALSPADFLKLHRNPAAWIPSAACRSGAEYHISFFPNFTRRYRSIRIPRDRSLSVR